MQTDIPLKRLTALRATDLIPLLGLPVADVQAVAIPELPMQKKYLDILLRVRSPQGQEYLHLLEWQGYYDATALWRLASYMSLVGQDEPHMTIIGTMVYLKPADDAGDTLTMAVDGQIQHQWPFRCVRLWEQDAAAAVATGNLALTTLSPLMHGADATLVEQAARTLLTAAPPPQQADLLAILGVFAAPIMAPPRFIDLVTKEKLMSSDLIEYLAKDIIAEQEAKHEAKWQAQEAKHEAKWQAQEAKWQAQEAKWQARLEAEQTARLLQTERETLEALVSLRFPDAPMRLTNLIRKITDVTRFPALRADIPDVPDVATLEQRLRDAAG
jgi:hypothetical protein